MSGRFTLSLLAVLSSFPAMVWGQSAYPVPYQAQGGPGYQAAPAGYLQGPSYGEGTPYSPPQGGQYPPGPQFGGGGGGYLPQSQWQQLPDRPGLALDEMPIDRAIKNLFTGATLRFDYLNMTLTEPGTVLLGSESGLGGDLRVPRVVFDDGFGNLAIGTAPVLDGQRINNQNGLKITLGLELANGTLESNVWGIDQNKLGYAGNLPQTSGGVFPLYIVQPVLVDMALSQQLLIWDVGYNATLRSQVAGSEINYLIHPLDPNGPAHFRPLLGIRYLNVSEQLRQRGAYNFTDVNGNPSVVTSAIDSTTKNHYFGPQVGARFELPSQWFTIGADAKLMLGVNTQRLTLDTTRVVSPDEAATSQRLTKTQFGPVAETNAFLRVHLRPDFDLFVAYDLIYAGVMTRPFNNVVYNLNGAGGTDFRIKNIQTDMLMHSVQIGGEFRF